MLEVNGWINDFRFDVTKAADDLAHVIAVGNKKRGLVKGSRVLLEGTTNGAVLEPQPPRQARLAPTITLMEGFVRAKISRTEHTVIPNKNDNRDTPLRGHVHRAEEQPILRDDQVSRIFAEELNEYLPPEAIPTDGIAITVADEAWKRQGLRVDADRAIVIGIHGFITLEHLHFMPAAGELVGEGLDRHFSTTCSVVVIVEREENIHHTTAFGFTSEGQ
jgi:hypothetical protein